MRLFADGTLYDAHPDLQEGPRRMTNTNDILVEHDDGIATVVLNKPDSHNAISLGMYRRIPEIFAELDADAGVKVVVVRGAGTGSFASGADISEFGEVRGNSKSARAYNEQVAGAEHAIERFAKPTIAMVHGYCIGGGCGVALACDLRSPTSGPGSASRRPSSDWSTAWSPRGGSSTSSGRHGPNRSSTPVSTSTRRMRCASD